MNIPLAKHMRTDRSPRSRIASSWTKENCGFVWSRRAASTISALGLPPVCRRQMASTSGLSFRTNRPTGLLTAVIGDQRFGLRSISAYFANLVSSVMKATRCCRSIISTRSRRGAARRRPLAAPAGPSCRRSRRRHCRDREARKLVIGGRIRPLLLPLGTPAKKHEF
jgi:hypothetical protein